MERTSADGALSDVSQVEASTGRRRDGETLYRRPPVQLPADDGAPAPGTTGSSWFGNGGPGRDGDAQSTGEATRAPGDPSDDHPYDGGRFDAAWSDGRPTERDSGREDWSEPSRTGSQPAERPAPRYGPTPPATSGRTSFGFSEGPISPGRAAAADLPSRHKPVIGGPSPAGGPSLARHDPSDPGDSSAAPSAFAEGRPAGTGSPVAVSFEDGSAGLPARTPGTTDPGWDGPEPVAGAWPLPKRGFGGYAGGASEVGPTGYAAGSPVAGSGGYAAGSPLAGSGGYAIGSPVAGSGGYAIGSPVVGPGGQSVADHGSPSRFAGRDATDEPVGNGRIGDGRTGGGRANDDGSDGRRPDRAPRPDRDGGERPRELPPRQSRLVTAGMVLLGIVVLVAGTGIGIVYFSGGGPANVLNLSGGNTAKRTVVAPLDNRTSAGFELLAAVSSVHVTIGELGDDLYRISTPDDAGIRPVPVIKGDDVQLQVVKDGDGRGGELDVVLSAAVRWQLRFSGYADQHLIDLSQGKLSGLEMVAGMHKVQLQLPRPSGTVPVKIAGAVEQLTVRSPADCPVRVKVGGGASTVVAGSRTLRNVPAGSSLVPKEWKTGSNRYDVTAASAIESLNVENLTQ